MAEKKEKPLNKYSIIVKYEHLNPRLQEIIGKRASVRDFRPPYPDTIRNDRMYRAFAETQSLLVLLLAAYSIKRKKVGLANVFFGVVLRWHRAAHFLRKQFN